MAHGSRQSARPTPAAAIEEAHRRQAAALAGRQDRFSQLLSRALRDEQRGGVVVSTSGLSHEEHAELARLTPEAHNALRAELDAALRRLRGLLSAGDPFFILSVVQDLNLFVPWGEYYEPTHEGSEAKVELVAGLLATQRPTVNRLRPSPAAVQEILDEVDHVVEILLPFNLSAPPRGGLDVAGLRFTGTMRWMSVRGNSFAGHGEELALEVYGPQNSKMLARLGFTVSDVVGVGRAVVSLVEERRHSLGEAGAAAANAELEREAASPGGGEETYGRAARANVSTVEAGLRGARTVTADQIVAFDSTLRTERTTAVLRELSVAVGSLASSAYTGLYDESPLRTRPFLELDGEYLLALPGALTRDVDTLLESRVVADNPGFSKKRARTLDRLAVGHLARLLPGAETHTNLFYEGNELDGLVLFEDLALVVEGKGSAISVQGQRGDTTRLGRDLEDAVEDAWRQGARAREYLLRGGGDAVFTDENGVEVVRVSASSVRTVAIVNPTLHELAGLAPQLPRLRALGLFAEGEFPWSIYINDLRVIAETCENAAVFLHYLIWRGRLPLGDRVIAMDEIDLWGSYLLCERFGILAEGGKVIVGNSSTDFDAYYDGLAGTAPRRDPPRKFLPEAVRAFVNRVAARRPVGWREATGVCLELSIPELAFLDVKLSEIAHEAARKGGVAVVAGRLALVGVPPSANPSEALMQAVPGDDRPTFAVACRLGATGDPELVWAQYRKPVTFELSEFERLALSAADRK